jgi:integrative and conjugative element protein (TIGR02256 family)
MRARRRSLAPGRLWLADVALEAMIAEARRMDPLETGGVLLGWQDADGVELMVASALGPGPSATHRRTRFSPDSAWQDGEIAARYELSGRTVTYLGDWHSHPGGTDTPSRRDERTARRIGRSRSARAHRPVMLILTGGAMTWRPVPYRSIGRSLRRMEIEPTVAAS